MQSILTWRLKIYLVVALMLICVAAVPQVFAQKTYPVISTDELKSLFDKKDKFVLIDARTEPEYAESHIVKAINIPDKKLDKNIALLPKDKSSLLIIYCNGVKCGKSKRLA